MYKGEVSDGLTQGDLELQIVPFRTGREVSINNYYYLDKMCHFGIVNFGKCFEFIYPQITQIPQIIKKGTFLTY